MVTNKNQMSIINEESIRKALETFKSAYKRDKEEYIKEGIKVEDVVNLTEGFSGKSTLLVTTVIISVMIAMPPREFIEFLDTVKSISKVKLLEAMKGLLEEKAKGADNDIDN